VAIRGAVRVAQLGEVIGERVAALSRHVADYKLKPLGPPFVRFHTFDDAETDVEIGVPVARPAVAAGRYVAGELPGGASITTWHEGSPDMRAAYARLSEWLRDNNRLANGPAWEVYHWIDVSTADESGPASPDEWRIELVQPLREEG
jgi:effector-binding domain-containing protein